MRPFQFTRADDARAAILAHQAEQSSNEGVSHMPGQYLAGGTTLLDLMKLDVMRPTRLIDLNALKDRRLSQTELRSPGATPHVETTLAPGELITAFRVPVTPFARRSLFLKIRDRESYEFALASAAVALDLNGGTVRQARIALGGVATVPWRAREAEDRLKDKAIDEQSVANAAEAAFAQAKPHEHN